MSYQSAKLGHVLTTQDASFLYGESWGGPMHIAALATFAGELTLSELQSNVASRIHLVPRYRQRLSRSPFDLAHPSWEESPQFRVRDHLFRHTIGPSANEDDLVQAALEENVSQLDRNRPLWEMHVFNGLEGGRSALLARVHHCMVDGVSGIELIKAAMDFRADSPHPPRPRILHEAGSLPGARRAAYETVGERNGIAMRPPPGEPQAARPGVEPAHLSPALLQVIRVLTRPIAPATWNLGAVTPQRSTALLSLPFADVRAVRRALGGTVNDVVLAILAEGAARYLRHHRSPTFGLPFRIGCPVSVRSDRERGALGNRVSMMFPEVASTPMRAAARLKAVSRETSRIKAAREPQALDALMERADVIPPMIMKMGMGFAGNTMDLAARAGSIFPRLRGLLPLPPVGINFIATMIPGVQVPLYLAGHQLNGLFGLLPLTGNLGYGVAICSYNHNLTLALTAEPRLMPDLGLMRSYIEEAFDELKKIASKITVIERRADLANYNDKSMREIGQNCAMNEMRTTG